MWFSLICTNEHPIKWISWTTHFVSDLLVRCEGRSRCSSGAKNVPILKRWKIGESVLSCDEERWRIRMDFQEGKFMFENWNRGYAVLFSERVRKNGISGQSPNRGHSPNINTQYAGRA